MCSNFVASTFNNNNNNNCRQFQHKAFNLFRLQAPFPLKFRNNCSSLNYTCCSFSSPHTLCTLTHSQSLKLAALLFLLLYVFIDIWNGLTARHAKLKLVATKFLFLSNSQLNACNNTHTHTHTAICITSKACICMRPWFASVARHCLQIEKFSLLLIILFHYFSITCWRFFCLSVSHCALRQDNSCRMRELYFPYISNAC